MKQLHYWILGILLVLVFLFIYDSYKANEEYTIDKLDRSNFIINNTEQKYLDTTLLVTLNIAGISGKTIMIENMSEAIRNKFRENGNLHLAAAVIGDIEGRQFILFVDEFSHRSAIEVMAHEVVHIMQYSSGRLKVVSTLGVIWESDTISFDILNDLSYRDRPWEMEAFDGEAELASRAAKILY